MASTRGWLSLLGALMVAGCSHAKPDAKVEEATDLVEQRTGHRPEWTVPWDDHAPAWNGQSVLTMRDAVVMALRNNRELRADLEMIGQADADLVQAGLLQNPVINFMIMFPDGGGRSMLRGNGLPMQPLQDLWMIPARKKVARAELQQAVLRVADRAVEVAANVKKIYARMQFTQRSIELIKENANVVDQSTQVIRVRQTAGKSSQLDVNRSDIRSLKLHSELLGMELEHHHAQIELLAMMGAAGADTGWKVEPLNEIKDVFDQPADNSTLLATAAEQRLDLKAAEWKVQSAFENIHMMRREGWPDLALGFAFERSPAPQSNNPSLAGAAGNGLAQRLANEAVGMKPPVGAPVMPFAPKDREVKYTLGPMLEMEIPIFDWGQAKVAKAVHEYRQRVAEYEARQQEVTRMVRDRLAAVQQAREQVRFYRESIVPAVERNIDVARRTFIAGQENLTVYLEVQEDLLMTRLKILEFFRDYLVARAELEREVGGRLELKNEKGEGTPPRHAAAPAASRPSSPVPRPSLFYCPMHEDVRRDQPGKCPKCGMELIPWKGGKVSE